MAKHPVILSYHHLCDVRGEEADRTTLSVDEFRLQIDALLERGWRFVDVQSLAEELTSPVGSGPSRVAISFDDGYESARLAAPLLAERGITATIFILTSAVGSNNLWNPRAHEVLDHLTLEQLQGLRAAGWGIQFHGTDHQRLTKFDADELSRRFEHGKAWFELHDLPTPAQIAYPYGAQSARVRAVAERHFQFGFSVTSGMWRGPNARHQLNRLEVARWFSPKFLCDFLETPLSGRRASYRAEQERRR